MLKIAVIGDVAIGNYKDLRTFEERLSRCNIDDCDLVILNLEGNLVETDYSDDKSLWNIKNIQKVLKKNNFHVTLANNHIFDIPGQLNITLKWLEQNDISYSGIAGQDRTWYKIFSLNERHIGIFPSCWQVLMNCHEGTLSVTDTYSNDIFNAIRNFKRRYANGVAIVIPHWSIDFEDMPFPRDRILARKWINAGADIVVGSHSHTIQDTEFYKNKPISYGLGNFLISNGFFRKGTVTYSQRSQSSLINKYVICFDNNVSLEQNILSETTLIPKKIEKSNILYIIDFVINRKKKILPMMMTLNPVIRRMSDLAIVYKIRFLRFLIANKIYRWKRH